MPKVKSEGILIIRFPPPTPKDLGRELRRAVHDLLEKAGSTSAINRGAEGWAFDIRIKKPADLPEWTERIRALLLEQGVPPESVLQASVRRGPLPLEIQAGPPTERDLAPLRFRDAAAWADVYLTLPDPPEPFAVRLAAVGEAIAGVGEVVYSCALPTYGSITVRVPDHHQLAVCLAQLLPALPAGTRLQACTESQPAVKPVTAG